LENDFLIYEDDEGVKRFMISLMQRAGVGATIVMNSAEAEQMAQDRNWKLILFDGSQGGWEAALRLYEQGKPVCVLSGDDPPDGYPVPSLLKPIKKDVLIALLHQYGVL
jgi:DNA-binding response OmpR family regulator